MDCLNIKYRHYGLAKCMELLIQKHSSSLKTWIFTLLSIRNEALDIFN